MGSRKGRCWVSTKSGEGRTLERLPMRLTGEEVQCLDILSSPMFRFFFFFFFPSHYSHMCKFQG